ncbi:MAG TPA: hypothetical protein VMF14_05035 [Solirubrobacteraceae bacterium]|nr:hypothetical protein [Solirubrobacteraceae bacterium]
MSAGVMLGLPAVAGAHRRAAAGETRAMVYNASSRYVSAGSVDEPRSAPLACFDADISTVVRGSRWGAWGFSRYAIQPAHQAQCHLANGDTIEHKIGARWYVVWQGSEGYPPTHTTHEGSRTLQGVPRAVAKDLLRGIG